MKMLFSVFIIDFSLPIILIRQKQDLPSRTATEKSTLARNKYLASSKCAIYQLRGKILFKCRAWSGCGMLPFYPAAIVDWTRARAGTIIVDPLPRGI